MYTRAAHAHRISVTVTLTVTLIHQPTDKHYVTSIPRGSLHGGCCNDNNAVFNLALFIGSIYGLMQQSGLFEMPCKFRTYLNQRYIGVGRYSVYWLCPHGWNVPRSLLAWWPHALETYLRGHSLSPSRHLHAAAKRRYVSLRYRLSVSYFTYRFMYFMSNSRGLLRSQFWYREIV